jgi:hypothetical protein
MRDLGSGMRVVKVAAGATGGLAILAFSLAFIQQNILLIVAACAMVAALASGIYLLILKWREKSRARALSADIRDTRAPRDVAADAAKKARYEDLKRQFREGLDKFESAGKSLYALPWVLMAGPPGSGKTEAIRHSELKFPTGLQDKLQGAGGTYSMNWWFTNHAVIIDTAGRLIMEDPAEWKDFLLRLKKARPRCPINGMILAIDVRRLIADDSAKIERDAGQIARQLEVIQRTLDVRFPVYVIVTMCDLLPGFREFFSDVNNPQLQQQMLGWSNPAELDTPFDPEEIEQHFEMVRSRLMDRRDRLILDPVHTTDPVGRRIDQVDALYAFPDQVGRILPRLKRWLELIFTAGEWSPKPLFLRGIYFNSAMQEGKELDEMVFRAMGKSAEEFSGVGAPDVFRRDRSYFIRDLFMKKVFVERGLVTDASNISRAQRTRRAALVAAGIAFFLVLLGGIWWSSADLRARIGAPSDFWTAIADVQRRAIDAGDGASRRAGSLALLSDGRDGRQYLGDRETEIISPETGKPLTRAELAAITLREAERTISPGLLTRILAAGFAGDVARDDRRAVHRQIIEVQLLDLVRLTRAELAREESWQSPDARARAAVALAQVLRLATFSAGGPPPGLDLTRDPPPPIIDVRALVDFLAPGDERARESRSASLAAFEATVTATYKGASGDAAWPPPNLRLAALGESDRAATLEACVANFIRYGGPNSGARVIDAVNQLSSELEAFSQADGLLRGVRWPGEQGPAGRLPFNISEHTNSLTRWRTAMAQLDTSSTNIGEAQKAIGEARLAGLLRPRPGVDPVAALERDFELVQGELPGEAARPRAEAPLVERLAKIGADLARARADQKRLLADAAQKLRAHTAGPSGLMTQTGDTGPFLVWRVHKAYDQVNAFVTAQSMAPAGDELAQPVGARVRAIQDEADRIRNADEVRAVSALAAGAGQPSWGERLNMALQAGARRRATDVVGGYLLAIRTRSDAQLQQLAVARHAQAEAAPAPPTLALPMTGISAVAERMSSAELGAGGASIVEEWAEVVRLVLESDSANQSPTLTPTILEGSRLRGDLTASTGINDFARRYASFWLREVPQQAVVDIRRASAEEWKTYTDRVFEQTRQADAASINRTLARIGDEVLRAADRLPESLRTSPDFAPRIASIRDDQARPGGMSSSEFSALSVTWYGSVRDLAGLPFETATQTILGWIRTNEFLNKLPVARPGETRAAEATPRIHWDYWNSLALAMVTSLSAERSGRIQRALAAIDGVARFPVDASSAAAGDLPPSAINDPVLQQHVDLILRTAPTTGGVITPGAGADTLDPRLIEAIPDRFREPVRVLAGGGSGQVDQPTLTEYRRRAGVLAALRSWPPKVTVRPALEAEHPRLRDALPGRTQASKFLGRWGVDIAGRTTIIGSIQGGEWSPTPEQLASDLRFVFYESGQDAPTPVDPTINLTGPWGLLRLLLRAGSIELPATPAADAVSEYLVPVEFTDAQEGRCVFWVKVTLVGVRFPPLSEWPGAARAR